MTLSAFTRMWLRHPDPRNLVKSLSGSQFQALRQSMLMTQAEAGAFLVDRPVSERAVQYWEAGRRAIPLEASRSLWLLVQERQLQLEQAFRAIEEDPTGALVVWYRTQEYWAWREQDVRYWKLHNSVAATVYAAGLAELVEFEPDEYQRWLAAHPRYAHHPAYQRHLQWARDVLWGKNGGRTSNRQN